MQKFVTMKKKSFSEGSLASHSSLMSHLQSLATAIADTKVLSAQQVIKNEAGEEVLGHLNILSVKNIKIWKCKLNFNYNFLFFLITLSSGLYSFKIIWSGCAAKLSPAGLPPRRRGEPCEGGRSSNFPHYSQGRFQR